jgi:hypothetical protein
MNTVAKIEQPGLPGVPAEAPTMMELVLRASRDPDVDVTKMERLMQMAREMRAEESERAFNEAMKNAQAEMPRIVRDASNSSTSSKYARLETIAQRILPTVTKFGFAISYGTADSPLKDHYRITALVSHVAGHSRDYFADVPADTVGMKGNQNKTATHGFGSTMSYGRRYLLLLIFNLTLVYEDDDGNGAGGGSEPISGEQLAEINDLMGKANADPEKFAKYMKVEALAELKVKDLPKAREALNLAIDQLNKKKRTGEK